MKFRASVFDSCPVGNGRMRVLVMRASRSVSINWFIAWALADVAIVPTISAVIINGSTGHGVDTRYPGKADIATQRDKGPLDNFQYNPSVLRTGVALAVFIEVKSGAPTSPGGGAAAAAANATLRVAAEAKTLADEPNTDLASINLFLNKTTRTSKILTRLFSGHGLEHIQEVGHHLEHFAGALESVAEKRGNIELI
jgi:hypothetical protein